MKSTHYEVRWLYTAADPNVDPKRVRVFSDPAEAIKFAQSMGRSEFSDSVQLWKIDQKKLKDLFQPVP